MADSDRVLRAALDAGIISLEPLDEGQWTELYAAYEASGCADLYQRHLGPIQVRPVGVSWEDFHRSSRSPAFIEGLASIRSRFARRTIDHPLRNGQFMLLNYPDGGGTCTSVGRMLPGAGLEARQLVLAIAGSRGYRAQDIPEETMARATRIADDHHVNRLRIGAVLWTAVQEHISAQGIRPSSAGGQVLFVDAKVGGGTLNGGDDPDVDEALGALRREADAIQAYLERQFQ